MPSTPAFWVIWTKAGEFRGEITLVVAGAPPAERPTDDELREQLAAAVATGLSKRDAAAAVAARHGLSKRDVYTLSISK